VMGASLALVAAIAMWIVAPRPLRTGA